jgi:integrase/recombinase XerC
VDSARLYDDFIAGFAPRTQRAYEKDLMDFSAFVGWVAGVETIGDFIVSLDHGQANYVMMEYKKAMVARGLAPATVNRRLSAVKSLVKQANLFGLISWSIETKGVRSEKTRDMTGPGEDAYKAMLRLLEGDDSKTVRNRAMVRLLYDSALRRSEVVSIDFEDLDIAGSRVLVQRKAHREKAWIHLPPPTLQVVLAWLGKRGNALGPLFTNNKGNRIHDQSLYDVVTELGDHLGITIRPHGLRRSAGTKVAKEKDIRHAQSFLGHGNVQTTMGYIDHRENEAKEAADFVAPPEEKKNA